MVNGHDHDLQNGLWLIIFYVTVNLITIMICDDNIINSMLFCLKHWFAVDYSANYWRSPIVMDPGELGRNGPMASSMQPEHK